MHSRIFAISSDKNAMSEWTEDEVYQYLENEGVDYATEQRLGTQEFENSVKWFLDCLPKEIFQVDYQQGSFMLKKDGRDTLKLLKLNEMMMQCIDLINDRKKRDDWIQMWHLREVLAPNNGFYVGFAGNDVELNNWDQYSWEGCPEETEFFIVQVFDYHW